MNKIHVLYGVNEQGDTYLLCYSKDREKIGVIKERVKNDPLHENLKLKVDQCYTIEYFENNLLTRYI